MTLQSRQVEEEKKKIIGEEVKLKAEIEKQRETLFSLQA